MKNLNLMIVLSLLTAVFVGGCSMSDDVVVEIGDRTISTEEFDRLLRVTYPRQDLDKISAEDRRKVLNIAIATQRRVLAAKAAGLQNDPIYIAETNENEEKFLAFQYYDRNVLPELLPDSLIRQYYDWQFNEVIAAAIVVGHRNASFFQVDRSEEDALAMAEKYRSKLANSDEPEKTAQALTDDKRNTALLSPYIIGRFEHQVNQAVMKAAVGETIGPIKTRRGYYLFRIIGKEQLPVHTDYESDRDRILLVVRQTFENRERTKHRQMTDSLLAHYNAVINEHGTEKFMAFFQEWSKKTERSTADFTDEHRSIVLATVNDQPYTAGDYLDQFNFRLHQQGKTVSDVAGLRMWLTKNYFVQRTWALAARKAGVDKDPEVLFHIGRFNDTKLSQMFARKTVTDGVKLTDEELQAHYTANIDRFTSKEKIRIVTLSCKNRDLANEVASKVRAGQTMENIPRTYRKAGKEAPIYLVHGFVGRDYRIPELVTVAMDAGADQVLGPLLINDTYYVARTGQHIPEKIQSFEEVRNSVHAALFNQRQKENEEKMRQMLKERYVAKINPSYFPEAA